MCTHFTNSTPLLWAICDTRSISKQTRVGYGGVRDGTVIGLEMNTGTRVLIQNETVYISLGPNEPGKGMNPTFLLPAMSN